MQRGYYAIGIEHTKNVGSDITDLERALSAYDAATKGGG